jgi:hypothetical protein
MYAVTRRERQVLSGCQGLEVPDGAVLLQRGLEGRSCAAKACRSHHHRREYAGSGGVEEPQ